MRKIQLIYIFFLIWTMIGPGGQAQSLRRNQPGFLIQSKPAGATVHIENEIIGKTPCRFPYELSGRYRLKAQKKGYETWSRRIDFDHFNRDSLFIALAPKRHYKAVLRSLVLPGWGQLYTDQKLKGRALMTFQVLALGAAGYAHLQYRTRLDDYHQKIDRYEESLYSYQKERKAWKDLTASHAKLEDAFEFRQWLLYASAGVYLWNLIDSIFKYPKHLRNIEIINMPFSYGSNNSIKIQVAFSL